MKTVSRALLSATCLTLIATVAEAQPSWPNWYVGLHGSLNFVGDEDVSGNPNIQQFDQDTGWGYGASLGYRPRVETGEWSNMRIEVSWHHQRADVNKISTAGGAFDGSGDVRVNAGLFNIFYDAATSMPEWRPYVGAGLGFADVQIKNPGTALATTNDGETVFAWNLQAGLGYVPQWMPFTEWTLGYRYFRASDAEFSDTSGNSFEVEYDSHNIEGGVKFLF